MSFLTARGLAKRFGDTVAVDGVDLDVERGDVLALLGPSGCGKTTTLRMLAGFEAPDAGDVVLDGRVLERPGMSVPPERRRVGLVFQDFALFPHMDVARNVAFGLAAGADRRARVGELLDLVGLTGLEQRMPHELSGGQQQRVAIARALAALPVLMLLDEPFSNLDPSIRQRVRAEVKQLIHQVGITAVFVTHDQEEALSLAEQVAVMIDGRIHQVGTPHEVYASPVNRAVGEFIGEANFLPAEVRGARAECELGPVAVHGDAHGLDGHAEVMLRAEDLDLVASGGVAGRLVGIEYYGHDMLVTVRLGSGRVVRVRQKAGGPAAAPSGAGDEVRVAVHGEALVFPVPGSGRP